jgi:hypothetical protein
MMRALFATTVLLAGVLIGFASPPTSAQGGHLQAGITSGEKLSLAIDPDRVGYNCTVIEVRGDFVGCRAEAQATGRPGAERWYNLRLVVRIDRPTKSQ